MCVHNTYMSNIDKAIQELGVIADKRDERSTWPSNIAPNQTRWIVRFGKCTATYYTRYHAEQFARALTLNGTDYQIEEIS